MSAEPEHRTIKEPVHCWCGGVIVTDADGEKRCSNADPNEAGP